AFWRGTFDGMAAMRPSVMPSSNCWLTPEAGFSTVPPVNSKSNVSLISCSFGPLKNSVLDWNAASFSNMNVDLLSHLNHCTARELGAQRHVAERETAVINRSQKNNLLYFGRPHVVLRRVGYDLNILRSNHQSVGKNVTDMCEIDFAPGHSPASLSIHRLDLLHRHNVACADEFRSESTLGPVIYLVGGSEFNQTAGAHDRHHVGNRQRLDLIVGDVDCR